MLNVEHVLTRLKIRHTSRIFAIADISVLIQDSADPIYTATKLFNDILSIPVKFKDAIHARIATKFMIHEVVVYDCKIDNDDIQDIVNDSLAYADKFCADPDNSYLWVKSGSDLSEEKVQVVAGVTTKVSVHKNGHIKKGGKKPLAIELYDKCVTKATEPFSRKDFIDLLIKELGLTVQAASTYHYNCKAKIPGWTPQE